MMVFSILRGIRFPSAWSYTHFLFNYNFGFIKRGLVGEIISFFNSPYLMSYDFFFYFSITILITNFILIATLVKDLIDSKNPILMGCAIIFVTGLTIAYLSHIIGYFDHIGLLLTLISLKINGFYKKFFFLLISMPIAVLIHEGILIMFFPIIFMSLVFSIKVNDEKITKKVLFLIVFSILMFGITLVINKSTLSVEDTYKMYESLQEKVEYSPREDTFSVLKTTLEDNLLIMKHAWFEHTFIALQEMGFSLIVTAPIFLFFIYFSTLILKQSKCNFYLIILSVLASISPLVLHIIALDGHRWNILTITTSFLMLYLIYKLKFKAIFLQSPSTTIYPILIFMIYFSSSSSIVLFDNYKLINFPFREHVVYIFNLFNFYDL